MIKTVPFLILGVLFAIFGLTIVVVKAAEPDPQIEITINNPYSFDVKAEIKCDWDHEVKAFTFYQKILIKKRSKALTQIPVTIHHCELWPKVRFF